MKNLIFHLQKFNEVTISSGETLTIDGIIFTALNGDAKLNLNNKKVSGITSGKVQATLSDSENSPIITFDASDGEINFSASEDGEVITVTRIFPIEFISGEFVYKGNKLTMGKNSDIAIESAKNNYSLRNQNHFEYGATYTFSEKSLTVESKKTESTYTLTDGKKIRELQLEASGKVINNFSESGFTLVKGSSETVKFGNHTLTATATEDAGINMELDADGIIFTPNKNDGALDIILKRGDTEIISGELECTSGKITIGYDNEVTFDKDTSFNFKFGDYNLSATATDIATTNISLTENGITFSPNADDGGLNVVLEKNGKKIFDGELNISGTIIWGIITSLQSQKIQNLKLISEKIIW